MPISDKDRKILWARSGNRCAICRHKLVIDETSKDDDSVIGVECHIAARSPGGPRFNPNLTPAERDDLRNLILLCGTHHKMIDDQFETYCAELLQQIKLKHEFWVDSKLKETEEVKPVRLRRFKENIPKELAMVQSGRQLLAMTDGCAAAYHHYDDQLNNSETDLIGGFFQDVQDYTDITSCMEPADQVRAAKDINDQLNELKENGFLVFAASEVQRLEGGVGSPQNWRVLHLSVCRASDPSIVWRKEEVAEPCNEPDGAATCSSDTSTAK